jgi:hypothetical protein
MILKFIIQEKGEETKELKFDGNYDGKDLEKIYKDLSFGFNKWFIFGSPPNGFITLKDSVKSVFLNEGEKV